MIAAMHNDNNKQTEDSAAMCPCVYSFHMFYIMVNSLQSLKYHFDNVLQYNVTTFQETATSQHYM